MGEGGCRVLPPDRRKCGRKGPTAWQLDADYRALRRTERHVAEELARKRRAHDEMKEELNGLKLMIRQLGGQLWRHGC